jgi:hypothetical protein
MSSWEALKLVMAWVITIGLGALWAIILVLIAIGRIDLSMLISEKNGQASSSRFQLLIFTFVVAMSFFYVAINSVPLALPDVPVNVLALLGISAGSYLVSKGIQTGGESASGPEGGREAKGGGDTAGGAGASGVI